MKQFLISATLLLVVWAGDGISAVAQPGSGGPGPGSGSPTAIPLDGGASLLLAGGVGYALKRLRGRQRA